MAAGDWKDMLSAIQAGDIDLVKYHLKEGVEPNYQHPEFSTTLLVESITLERYALVKLLLENGADPSLRVGISQDSPIRMAKKSGNKAIIHLVQSYLPFKKNIFVVLIEKCRELVFAKKMLLS